MIMATPTHEEIQEFIKEEIEYTTPYEELVPAYIEAVIIGNANDSDD